MERDVFEDCSIVSSLKLLGKRWIVFILSELMSRESIFFSDLQKTIHDKYGRTISGRVLSDGLTLLEQSGIINRKVMADSIPVRVSYSLTEKGSDLKIVFGVLKGWGVKYGDIRQKVCKSFSCVHNAVGIIDLDKAKNDNIWITTALPTNIDLNEDVLTDATP
ncbi:MAG TPA: helix-turn-helix domain-containing protein [Candidatus Hodarchaeales archaeon]|nr:helix-turn-helix domain-containing protein [Candidatus Hodarchaeales archaeon]